MMCSPGNKLNRSCSESDLYKVNFDNSIVQDYSSKKLPFVSNRALIVEEIAHVHHSSGLLRSSLCGQSIPSDLHNLQNFFSTSLVLNTPFNECDISNLSLNTELKSHLPKVESSRNCMENEGVTPMEVDVLNNSLKFDDCDEVAETTNMDIDLSRFTKQSFSVTNADDVALKNRYASRKKVLMNFSQEFQAVRNELRNKTELGPFAYKTSFRKKQSRRNNFVLIVSVCLGLIFVYSFFMHDSYLNFIAVNSDVQLENIQKDLEKVHKQETSVKVVVQTLERRNYWKNKIKVLAFIGPTGVGKTFVANIIKKHFHRGLIHELYGIQLNYKSQWEHILTTLRHCCFNLIIIDDLKKKNLMDVFALIHSLPQDQFILVISIFNIQYYDGNDYTNNFQDISQIRDDFDNSGIYHELIVFQEFNIDEVKYWIKEQLKLKNVENKIQEKILKTVLEGHIVQYQGLKGLYSKILLELEKYK